MNQLANQDQAARWNDASGHTWVEMQEVLDRLLAPFGELLVEEAFPGKGSRVLDIGCGAGATTFSMARLLGLGGLCLGADISQPLTRAAKARAASEGAPSAQFVEVDAQTYAFEPDSFDSVMSRFGVMFFDDPVAAFVNIRRAARPAAKLTLVVWRGPAENPFMTTAVQAAGPLLPELVPPDPSAPGQFAFADGDRVRHILSASGLEGRQSSSDRYHRKCFSRRAVGLCDEAWTGWPRVAGRGGVQEGSRGSGASRGLRAVRPGWRGPIYDGLLARECSRVAHRLQKILHESGPA